MLTVRDAGADVDDARATFPEYEAVRDSGPAGRFAIVRVATPDALGVAVPRVVPPFKNVTVPSELPAGAGEMVSVSVTF